MQLETTAGTFTLARYPARKQESLRAWNAADTLLIERVLTDCQPGSLLVVNDEQGALSVALQPTALWSDSALSVLATAENLRRNNRSPVPAIPSTQIPTGHYDTVAIKVPKLGTYFEYQLSQLAASLAPGTSVLAAGMDKHLSSRTGNLLEQYIGPTQRHRGQSKARVFTSVRDERQAVSHTAETQYHCEALDATLVSLANVFSREKMDAGSRFLIEQMGQLEPVSHVIDLACGNGILGLVAKARGLGESLDFIDESAMAVASARLNAEHLYPAAKDSMGFHQGDGLVNFQGKQAELILCNPPFHANHAVEEYVGRRLLAQCANYLGRSGKLCLVANRHLQYLPTLKHGFSRVDKLAENSKFIVWQAQK
ncbi:MAG: methyltransferase [Halioglobus sp.]